jgi:TrmH family RNA methyltransferase
VKLLSLARDLKRRKAREREGAFVVEGIRAVEELLRSKLSVTGLLVAPKLVDSPRGTALVEAARARALEVLEVDEKEFRSAAETDSPQGIVALAQRPDRSLESLDGAAPLRLLLLDAVQDPGNVGTIIRTAAALGATATIALPGTVDVPQLHCPEPLTCGTPKSSVAQWARTSIIRHFTLRGRTWKRS